MRGQEFRFRNGARGNGIPLRKLRPRAGSTTRDHDDISGLPIPEGRQVYTPEGLLVDGRHSLDDPGYDGIIEQPATVDDPQAEYLDEY